MYIIKMALTFQIKNHFFKVCVYIHIDEKKHSIKNSLSDKTKMYFSDSMNFIELH